MDDRTKYDFDRNKNPKYFNDYIYFLNEPIVGLYTNSFGFEDFHYRLKFKGELLSMFIDIERTFRGTFNSGLLLEKVDEELFNKMFPTAIQVFKQLEGSCLDNIRTFFRNIRNLNAHAKPSYSSIDYLMNLKIDLSNQRSFNEKVYYNKNSKITVAGIIFLGMLFLREESINQLTSKNNLFGIVSCGKHCSDKGTMFVSNISHVNLELPISLRNNKSVVGSLLGIDDMSNNFSLLVGEQDTPFFSVNGSYEGKTLTIRQGSVSQTYYETDFCLFIENEQLFIDESNKLPPMVLVDVFHYFDIHIFNESTLNDINSKNRDISKLNKPKFYADKNIEILFAPESLSDIRKMSTCFNDSIGVLMLDLEDYLIRLYSIKIGDDYSSIESILRKIGVPNNIITNMHALRVFVFHGFILGETCIIDSKSVKYNYQFVINTLKELLDFFRSKDERLFEYLQRTITISFVQKVVNMKYYTASKRAVEVLKSNLSIDFEGLQKANRWIYNSSFDVNLLAPLTNRTSLVYEITIKDFEHRLFVSNDLCNDQTIEKFANENNLAFVLNEDGKIVSSAIIK